MTQARLDHGRLAELVERFAGKIDQGDAPDLHLVGLREGRPNRGR
jgi:hypothetical protein